VFHRARLRGRRIVFASLNENSEIWHLAVAAGEARPPAFHSG